MTNFTVDYFENFDELPFFFDEFCAGKINSTFPLAFS